VRRLIAIGLIGVVATTSGCSSALDLESIELV
jgi:hypothetical protein